MHILFLTHNVTWTGGGAFFNAFHRARHLVRRGHQVSLLTISPSSRACFNEIEREGVHIVESPDLLPGVGRSGWDAWDTLQRLLYVRRGRFDIVHGNESRPVVAFPALWLQRVRGVPTVLDWMDWYGRGGTASERGHLLSTFMAPVETFLEEAVHPLADGCVAMGEPLYRRALSVGIPRERMINLLHGCDPEGLAPLEPHEARQRLDKLTPGGYILGHLGVLRRANAELMLEAFRLLKQELSAPIQLVLIGNHKLRDLPEMIPADCRSDVIETGWISYEDLNLYLSASDLLLLPFKRAVSTDNIWPSKVNDHFSVGRATVATRMQVLQPVFDRYEIGVLTDDEPAAFAAGCKQLLQNPPLRQRMGQAARNLAEGELAWEQIVARLEGFYLDTIAAVRERR